MYGYAKDSDRTDVNTQKYNCHKLVEYGIGAALKSDLQSYVKLNLENDSYDHSFFDSQLFE